MYRCRSPGLRPVKRTNANHPFPGLLRFTAARHRSFIRYSARGGRLVTSSVLGDLRFGPGRQSARTDTLGRGKEQHWRKGRQRHGAQTLTAMVPGSGKLSYQAGAPLELAAVSCRAPDQQHGPAEKSLGCAAMAGVQPARRRAILQRARESVCVRVFGGWGLRVGWVGCGREETLLESICDGSCGVVVSSLQGETHHTTASKRSLRIIKGCSGASIPRG